MAPVLVGVARVVVEPVAEPVPGRGGEQPQHHLQGAAADGQDGFLRAGGDLAGGSLGGESIHRVTAAAFAAARPGIWPGGLHQAPTASAGCAPMRAP